MLQNHKVTWVSCYQAPFQHNWVYVNEGDFLKYLTYGGGGWFPGELTKNRGLELSVASPNFLGKGEGLEVKPISDVDDLINLAYVMKIPEKSKRRGWERFWVGEH